MVVQWLRLCAPNAGGRGLIPGQGTKILCCATRNWHDTTRKIPHAPEKSEDPESCTQDLVQPNK